MLFGLKYNKSMGHLFEDVLFIPKNTYWQWLQAKLQIQWVKRDISGHIALPLFCGGCGNASP